MIDREQRDIWNDLDLKLWVNILCLDLGTKTGWSMSRSNTDNSLEFDYGTKNFSTQRWEGGGKRYLRFEEWLDEIKRTYERIDDVFFEQVVMHSGTAPAHVYGGFLATLTMWCEKHHIRYEGVPVGTIKKYITGKGNASKEMVIDAVKQRGYNVEDDNEADAMALALYVRRM
jgi:Holliday junction resolvasome RuvABC endonuclease subunit